MAKKDDDDDFVSLPGDELDALANDLYTQLAEAASDPRDRLGIILAIFAICAEELDVSSEDLVEMLKIANLFNDETSDETDIDLN